MKERLKAAYESVALFLLWHVVLPALLLYAWIRLLWWFYLEESE